MFWLAKYWWNYQNTPSESQELGKRKNHFGGNGKLHNLLHSLFFLKLLILELRFLLLMFFWVFFSIKLFGSLGYPLSYSWSNIISFFDFFFIIFWLMVLLWFQKWHGFWALKITNLILFISDVTEMENCRKQNPILNCFIGKVVALNDIIGTQTSQKS